MIPNTLNSDTHVNQIEIQNEVKTTQTKNSVKKSTTTSDVKTTAKNLGIHNQEPENTRNQEHETNEEVINKVVNVDTTVGNIQEHVTSATVINISRMTTDTDKKKEQVVHPLYPANQQLIIINPPEYWVQFNRGGGSGAFLDFDSDRNSFVKIVFAILLLMLILTAGYVAFVLMTENVKEIYLQHGTKILIFGSVGMIGLNYAMMCSHCTRMPPCNFICLFLAVCFMSMITSYVTAKYRTDIVLLALLATIITVIVCLCLACTSFDFTKYLLYVIVISAVFGALVLVIFIASLITKTRYKPLTVVILVVGTLITVVSFVIELQMILGGRTVEVGEDDYALGAFMLYTSIIDIFVQLVHLLGILDDD